MILQKSIARRMRIAMSSENLTILELANKLGLAKSSVEVYLRENGNPRADTIELIYENLGYPLENFLKKDSPAQNIEKPDFLSLAGSLETIHPMLMPVVSHSFQMAQDIIELSDMLYELDGSRNSDQ